MTRMLSLAALALACAASPAFAHATVGGFGSSVAGAVAGILFLALGVAFVVVIAPRLPRIGLGILATVLFASAALAAEVVAPVPVAPAVILP